MRKNNHNFDSEFLVKAETAKNFLCPADITRYSPKKPCLPALLEVLLWWSLYISKKSSGKG